MISTEGNTGYPEGYLKGLACFNARQFWECHEAVESAWLPVRKGEVGPFYKGIIQLASACYKLHEPNFAGAERLFASSRSYLERFRPRYMGLEIDRLIADLERCRDGMRRWRDGEIDRFDASLFPYLDPAGAEGLTAPERWGLTPDGGRLPWGPPGTPRPAAGMP